MRLAKISTSRTTASHQIATKTDIVTNLRKDNPSHKTKTKGKKQHSEPEANFNASDEDDSLERKAALSSPVKGIAARKASKVSNH